MDVLSDPDVGASPADLNRTVLGDVGVPVVVGALALRADARPREIRHVHADSLRACTPEIQIRFIDALLVRSDMPGIDIADVHACDGPVAAKRDRSGKLGSGG